jgi:hypothetical protein
VVEESPREEKPKATDEPCAQMRHLVWKKMERESDRFATVQTAAPGHRLAIRNETVRYAASIGAHTQKPAKPSEDHENPAMRRV